MGDSRSSVRLGNLVGDAFRLSAGVAGLVGRPDRGDARAQLGEFPLNHVPDDGEIDVEVGMGEAIAKTAHLLPRKVGVGCLKGRGYAACRLADNFQVAEDGVLRAGVGEEGWSSARGVPACALDCDRDVLTASFTSLKAPQRLA